MNQQHQQNNQEYITFLGEVLQATSDSNGDAKIIYPILAANQDKLNRTLVAQYQNWANNILSQATPEQAPNFAVVFVNFSNLIQQFPLGNRASNLDIAIIGYELALTIFTRADFPQSWAATQNNLAIAYYYKITGNRAENLDEAIRCYQLALEVRTRADFPQDWAMTQNNLGNAYSDKITGNRAENLDEAIRCYQQALEVYTRADFPQDWAKTQNNLANAYSDKITGNKAENLDEAIRCYQQALEVRTRADFPQDWAATQNGLGIAYKNKITGNRAENLDEAIRCFQLALEVRTRADFPEQWARTQNNLGTAYNNKITGNRAENIDSAIACFQRALEVRTHEDFPQDWAMTYNGLGHFYSGKITGNSAQNIDEPIAYYQRALEVITREDFPQNWTQTQNNLAIAYSNKITGNRAQNIDKAIACYQRTLEVITREDFPQNWATTQNNLGLAYSDKITGNRAENLDEAIRCYQLALEVYTRADFPQEWAMTQNNLGGAYNNKITGNKAENLDEAIRCYQQALEVYTRADFPQNWATTQNNLGGAYNNKITGNKAENLDEAIRCYQRALEVYTRADFPQEWAMTQNNLANAYSKKITGNKAENLDEAIRCYQQALEVYTRADFPQDWAMTQNNLGEAYWNKITDNKAENLDEAIRCFRLALEFRTPTTLPLDCLQSGRNLGNFAFNKGLWEIAIEGYAAAILAVEQIRIWSTTDASRQQIIADFIDVYENIIQAYINSGNLNKAIEYVDRSSSKRLVDLMASNDLYADGEIPPQVKAYLQQYDNIQAQIDTGRQPLQGDTNSSQQPTDKRSFALTRDAVEVAIATLKTLEAQKQQIWEQMRRLDPVLAGEIQVTPLDFRTIQQLIEQPKTAIINFFTTKNDTHIFIIYKHKKPKLYTCTGFGYQTLQDLVVDEWLTPYSNKKDGIWQAKISDFLQQISEKLQLKTLVQTYLKDIEELIIIPHLYWHQIPFAALPLTVPNPVNSQPPESETISTEYLGDKFRIRYVPSSQILQYCQQRPPLSEINYGTVENADDTLPNAEFECEQIAKFYNIPENLRLKGRSQATVSNYRQLAKQVQVLHSSHHASSRLDSPLESCLLLADGKITLGQIMSPGFRLPNLSDVFLSCCETNLGVAGVSDDILSLSTGFLCAGARSVVSTLWSVDDLATALFCIFYYQNRRQGLNRPEALRKAQIELRTMTGKTLADQYQSDLNTYLKQQLKQLDPVRLEAKAQLKQQAKNTDGYREWKAEVNRLTKIENRIKDYRDQIKKVLPSLCLEAFPFAKPFYWAGFICSGLS